MNKRTEITSQTRQNFIDAFWSLYCEMGIERITVKQITTKAGYNRGTFYEYFIDVYDVLDEIEKSLIPSLNTLPPVSTSTGSIGMPIDLFLKIFEQNRKYYSVLLGDNGDPGFASQLKNSIKPVLLSGFAVNSRINPKELDYILEYTLSAMIGVMIYWFKEEEPQPSESLIELIHRIMQNGIMDILIF